jgi:hypothetical protein
MSRPVALSGVERTQGQCQAVSGEPAGRRTSRNDEANGSRASRRRGRAPPRRVPTSREPKLIVRAGLRAREEIAIDAKDGSRLDANRPANHPATGVPLQARAPPAPPSRGEVREGAPPLTFPGEGLTLRFAEIAGPRGLSRLASAF